MSEREPDGGAGGEKRQGAPAREADDRGAASDLDETLASENLPEAVPCPFCESTDTNQFAVFGGQASTSQYYCNGCRTVFDFMRWR